MGKITNRSEKVDILRGIAIISVYLVHSVLRYPIDISGEPGFGNILDFIIPYYMPLFFVISGFCYKKKQYIAIIRDKSRRLIIPYVFVGAMTSFFNVFGGRFVNGDSDFLTEIRVFLFMVGIIGFYMCYS